MFANFGTISSFAESESANAPTATRESLSGTTEILSSPSIASKFIASIVDIAEDKDRFVELCYLGEYLIGFVYGKIDREEHRGYVRPGWGYVMEFYIKPEYRRNSYGRENYKHLENILKSNTSYNGYIELVDIAGNIMKIEGNTFDFTTLKSPPVAKISVQLSKNFTQADIKFEITNPDKMKNAEYRYVVYDSLGKELSPENNNGKGSLNEGTTKVTVRNLYAESLYIAKVYASYTDAVGEYHKDQQLTSYEFITYDVGRLGAIDFAVDVQSVSQTAAVISFQYSNYNEANPLFDLIDQDIVIAVYDINNPNVRHEQNYDKLSFQTPVTITLTAPNFAINTNTIYRIDIIPTIGSGGKTYDVDTNLSTKEFQTLKSDTEVFITNGFVSLGYIDYDVCVLDVDEAIVGDDVLVKIIDSDGNVQHIENIEKRSSCTPVEGENLEDVYSRISACD